MVLYPPPTRPWVYCRLCGVRLTREPIDVPFPGHESWCTPWSRMVNRLLGALAEDDIYSRTFFHRWGDFSERLFLEYAVGQKTSGVLPRPSCAGAPSNPYLSPARPSSLPPRSGGRARPAKLQRVPRQDLEQFARRLQGWTEKHPPFRKGWTDPRGNHICGSGHIHSRENLARAWHDGHAVPRA